jgi:tetratricopeptide (TPR) repeat protein
MKALIFFGFLFLVGCGVAPKDSAKEVALSVEQQDLFDEYFFQAEAARQRNQFPDAYKWYEKASALNPASGNAWYQMARISLENNQLQRAFEQSQKAMECDPNNYWFLHLYAQLATQGKKISVVKEAYENPKRQPIIWKWRITSLKMLSPKHPSNTSNGWKKSSAPTLKLPN